MSVRLQRYDGAAVQRDAELRRRMGSVYDDAFGAPPYDAAPGHGYGWAEDGLLRHAGYPGFALTAAVDGDAVLGFGYGLVGAEDQWFTQTLRRMLRREITDAWVGGHGELVELAVRARAQGRGIGGRLHDAVLADLRAVGAERALLTTHSDAERARALYLGRGWATVAEVEPASVLMGIRLASARRDEPHRRS